MAQAKMPQLVRENRFDFRRRQPRQQRIEENDALRVAETREVGIAMAGAPRPVHHHQSLDLEAAAVQQFFDALLEVGVVHGGKLVEKRCDPRGIDREDE
jgi:hypothetical protein